MLVSWLRLPWSVSSYFGVSLCRYRYTCICYWDGLAISVPSGFKAGWRRGQERSGGVGRRVVWDPVCLPRVRTDNTPWQYNCDASGTLTQTSPGLFTESVQKCASGCVGMCRCMYMCVSIRVSVCVSARVHVCACTSYIVHISNWGQNLRGNNLGLEVSTSQDWLEYCENRRKMLETPNV